MPQFNKNTCLYTPLFCEENIWQLINSLYMNHYAKPIEVLFIINQNSSIALFDQNQSNFNEPVIWDYHVILVALKNNQPVIFDFDSRCDFPTKINDYFELTFPVKYPLSQTYQPYIKAIAAAHYLKHFYSDRHHMLGLIEESQFPQYKIIQPNTNIEKLTLKQCRSLDSNKQSSKIILPDDYLKQINNSLC